MTTPYKKHEVMINGHQYEIMAFPARYGLTLMAQLTKYISNVLHFLPAIKGSLSFKGLLDLKIDANLIDQVIDSLQSSLDDERLIDLIIKLVKYSTRDGKDLSQDDYFNLVFAENYDELFILIKEVIVINFLSQSFMKKLSNSLEQVKNQVTTQEPING